jgi:hypothetical protein
VTVAGERASRVGQGETGQGKTGQGKTGRRLRPRQPVSSDGRLALGSRPRALSGMLPLVPRHTALALVLIGSLAQACARPEEAPPSTPRALDPSAAAPGGPPGFVMLDVEGPEGEQGMVQARPASRPRLRETKVIGRTDAPSYGDVYPAEQSWGPSGGDEVYDCGASCSSAPAGYGSPGYVTYAPYGYGGYRPAVRPSGGRSGGASSAPPVGGNWPSVPSYGPAAMGDHGRR